jgi:hypothetical protein
VRSIPRHLTKHARGAVLVRVIVVQETEEYKKSLHTGGNMVKRIQPVRQGDFVQWIISHDIN